MSTYLVSALFSTFNRAGLLREALDGLVRQTLPVAEFEVVIVDDGSSDNTREVVGEFSHLLNIKYAYQENSGLAAGKNAAVRMATAPIVVFMDDDDVAAPELLAEHLSTHAAHPDEDVAVLGYTDLRGDIADIPLMHFVTEVGCFLFCYPRIEHLAVLDYTYFWGGRSSCKRSLLERHGLFNPVFRFGCEDIELGYRLSRHGLKVVYNRNARSTMIRAVSLLEFCRRVERQGRSNWVFSRMHPSEEVRSWCLVGEIDADWNRLGRQHGELFRVADRLDRIAQARRKYGLQLDELTLRLLHRAYWDVIAAYRIKGSYEAKVESNR